MKRSIREKNSIVISLVFYLILVVWLILFFLFTILSDIKEIENKKINTENLFKDIVDIEKNGLSYEEFKSMTNSNTLEGKWKEILNSISKDFFNKNFKNTTDESFNDFIKNSASTSFPTVMRIIYENNGFNFGNSLRLKWNIIAIFDSYWLILSEEKRKDVIWSSELSFRITDKWKYFWKKYQVLKMLDDF